jgi:hypothetical protein
MGTGPANQGRQIDLYARTLAFAMRKAEFKNKIMADASQEKLCTQRLSSED